MSTGYLEPLTLEDDRVLLGVPDAARLLSVGRSTVYELLACGDLASVKIGARRLVPRRAIEEFSSKKQNAQPPTTRPGVMEKADAAAIPES